MSSWTSYGVWKKGTQQLTAQMKAIIKKCTLGETNIIAAVGTKCVLNVCMYNYVYEAIMCGRPKRSQTQPFVRTLTCREFILNRK